jgi:hypothetical protein
MEHHNLFMKLFQPKTTTQLFNRLYYETYSDWFSVVIRFFLQVEEQMIVSVRNEIENSHKVYPKCNRANWVLEWAGQVVLCVAMIYWTAEVQHILRLKKSEKLKEYHNYLQVSVNSLFLSIIA